MLIEISNGELVDKVTILNIKKNKISSEEKRKNVEKEYIYLKRKMESLGITENSKEYKDLLEINLKLWDLEDKIRILERDGLFDEEFIEIARLIYKSNDKRAKIKRGVNEKTNSSFFEEKELPNYK